MGWRRTLLDWVGFRAEPSLAQNVEGRSPSVIRHRSFAAAAVDRLTRDWSTGESTLNNLLYRQLRILRARSQTFCRDTAYGRRYIRLIGTNIVGHVGFRLSAQPKRPDGSLDVQDAVLIEAAFGRWSRHGACDVTGRLSFADVQRLIVTAMARDGEALVRIVRGSDRGPHHIQLQVLPAYLLNENHNELLRDGARISMGVELDRFGQPRAYHLSRPRPDTSQAELSAERPERVPAQDMFHLYLVEEAGQVRGCPWTVAALLPGNHLKEFDNTALVVARAGAAKMGFFRKTDQSALDQDAETIADARLDTGEFITESEPGHWGVLPPGYDMTSYDPKYPDAAYEPFQRAQARRVSAALSSSYAALTQDRSSENFSSIRTGSLDDREGYMEIQQWLDENFLTPLFSEWLALALLYDADLQRLPYAKFDKFNSAVWQPKRWDWVDPEKDVAASVNSIAAKLKSRSEVIRASGRDPEKVFAEIEQEESRFGPVQSVQTKPPAQEASNVSAQ